MESIIFHNSEKCVGCNRCVKSCPVEEATVTSYDKNRIDVYVDSRKCISCGTCIRACHHNARTYKDDTQAFFNDLKNNVQISIIAAPAIRSNFPQWKRILTWLKNLGVMKIFDVSLGADICTWAHVRHIQKHGVTNMITQPCPVVTCQGLFYHALLQGLILP